MNSNKQIERTMRIYASNFKLAKTRQQKHIINMCVINTLQEVAGFPEDYERYMGLYEDFKEEEFKK